MELPTKVGTWIWNKMVWQRCHNHHEYKTLARPRSCCHAGLHAAGRDHGGRRLHHRHGMPGTRLLSCLRHACGSGTHDLQRAAHQHVMCIGAHVQTVCSRCLKPGCRC